MYHSRESILQNLRDAGCDPGLVKDLLSCWEAGKTRELLRLLAKQRELLLAHVHQEEKRIDCLDYLVFELERGGASR